MRSVILLIFLFIALAEKNYAANDISRKSISYLPSNTGSLPLSFKTKNSRQLRGKRYFFIGESDHFHEEKYSYRLKFIKFALENGFFKIYSEMGRADAKRMNQYLKTGDESFLDQMRLYQTKKTSERIQKLEIYDKQLAREFYQLKKIYPELEFFGWDLDMRFDRKLTDLKAGLDLYTFDELDPVIEKIDTASKGKSSFKKADLLEEALIELTNLEKLFKSKYSYEQYLNLYLDIKVYSASFRYSKRMYKAIKDENAEEIMKTYAYRESMNIEHWQISSMLHNSSDKFIFLGHNGHLIKNLEDFEYKIHGINWPMSIGDWINRNEPGKAFILWAVNGQGNKEKCRSPKCPFYELVEGSLEDDLTKISEAYSSDLYIDLRDSYFDDIRLMHFGGNGPVFVRLDKAADAIYFVYETSPFITKFN